jgi:dipeptidyl aminopeptidase/acylaminoacyl peptidase
VTFAGGKNEIVLIEARSDDVVERLNLPSQIGEITSPSWSPDGGTLVFSGQDGGLTDLYLYDLESDVLSRLTNDRHAVFQPAFSPSGDIIAFVSDRGDDTDFDCLTYSEMQIALFHLEDGEIEVLDLFGDARHINPQFSPDGQSLYFVSDPDGFSNIYRVNLADRSISRVTNVTTAVSGIGAMSPAMSVARETGTVVFSVFDEFGFHVYSMDSRDAPDAPILAENIDRTGRFLPLAPDARRIPSRVATYLANADTGLHPPGSFLAADAENYRSSLSLDYISQVHLGAGSDAFGTFVLDTRLETIGNSRGIIKSHRALFVDQHAVPS